MKENMKQNIKQTIALILACGMILTALWLCRQEYARAVQMSLAEKVLRFHVIAESNSEEDQQIKLMVRDEVANYVTVLLEDSDSLEETVGIIQANMDEINDLANEVLRREGVTYLAQTSLTYVEFPEKVYSDFVFPEGEYQALRIVLGDGEGENWWCVMYPPICKGLATDNSRDDGAHYSGEEYALISSGKYNIKFKILEALAQRFKK